MNPTLSNRIILVLALAGAGVSLYLTLAHLNALKLVCGKLSDCETVALHYTAKGFGIPALQPIPTAAFGLMMYVAMVILCFVRVSATGQEGARFAANLQLGLAVVGAAVSAWLTYLEAYVIKAWCQWCVVSAVLILIILLTAAAESIRGTPVAQGEPT